MMQKNLVFSYVKNIVAGLALLGCAVVMPVFAQSDCSGSGCGKLAKAVIRVSGSAGSIMFFNQPLYAPSDGGVDTYEMNVTVAENGIFSLSASVPPVSGPNDVRHGITGEFTITNGCKSASGIIWAGGKCEALDQGCIPYPCPDAPEGESTECCTGYHCSDDPEGFPAQRSETYEMKSADMAFADPGVASEPATSNSTTGGAVTPSNSHKADDQVSMSFSLGYGLQSRPIGSIVYTVSTGKDETSVPGMDTIAINLTGLELQDILQTRNLSDGRRQYFTGSALVEFKPVTDGMEISTYSGNSAIVPTHDWEPIEPSPGSQVAKVRILRLPFTFAEVIYKTIRIVRWSATQPSQVDTFTSYTPSTGPQSSMTFRGSKMIKRELTPPVGNDRDEIISVYARDPATPDNEPKYFKVSEETHKYRRFVTSSFSAERLIETRLGVSTAPQQVTQYYYENSTGEDAYGELRVKIHPDGSWTRYDYHNDTAPNPHGPVLKAEYSSWLDAGGAGTAAPTLSSILAVPATDCVVVEYEETKEPVYFKRMLRKIKGLPVSRTEITKESALDAFSGENVEVERTIVYDGSGKVLSDDRRAIKRSLPEGGVTSLAEELVYDTSADGSRRSYSSVESVDELVGATVTSTVVHGTQLQPAGIASKTLKEVRVTGPGGFAQTSSYVFKGGSTYDLASQETRSSTVDNLDRTETVTRDGATVSTVSYLANGTEDTADDTVETVDAYGVKSVRSFNPSTAVETLTRVGGGQVLSGTGQQLFAGHDVISKTSYLPRPPVSSQVPPGQVIKTEVTANGVTRQTSWIEYDDQGRQVKSVDAEGITQTSTYQYTNGMLTVAVIGPGNVKQTTEYYRDGRLKTVEMALTSGPVTSSPKTFYTYDIAPGSLEIETVHVKTATDPRWSRTVKDGQGRTVLQERPGTGGSLQKVENFYDSKGNLVRIRRSGFLKDELMEYDSLGKLFRRGYDLNDNGVLDVASSDPIVETTQYYEQVGGDWWQSTRTRVYEQNQGGYRESYTRSNLKGIDGPSETWTNGQLDRSVTTQINRSTREKTTTTYLPTSLVPGVDKVIGGLRFYSRAPGGLMETEYRYTPFFQASRMTVPGGHVSYTYDSYGRIATETQATDATGNDAGTSRVTTYTYYASNLTTANAGKLQTKSAPTSAFSPTAQVTNFKYDSLGRPIGEWGPGTLPVKYDYNDYGERDRMTLYQTQAANLATEPAWTATPNGLTTWIYDAASGLLTSKKDNANQSASYAYHAGTNLVQTRTWARGIVTTYSYDGLGRETGRDYSDATTDVTIAYRRDGAVEQITDASGNRTLNDWDRHGHPQKEIISGTGSLSGLELVSPRDPFGRRTGFQARLTGTSPARLQLPSSVWEYGTDGHLSKIQQGTLNVSLSHAMDTSADTWTLSRLDSGSAEPALATVSKSNLPRGRFSVAHGRSSDFAQSRVRSDSTGIVDYTDPSLGVLTPDSESASWQYSWDSRGQIASARKYLGNGVNAYAKLLDTTYKYDDAGNRKEAKNGTGAGTAQVPGTGLTLPTFAVNALNQITTITHPTNLVYVTGKAPAAMTLRAGTTSATTAIPDRQGHYFSDALARPSGKYWVDLYFKAYTGTTTPPNALRSGSVYVPANSEALTYDVDGNLETDDRWNYTWDAENRLIGMNTKTTRTTAAAGAPNLKLTFTYDAGGRRIGKKLEKTVSGVSQTLNDVLFIYDGWNLVGEVETYGSAADKPGNNGTARFLRRTYLWGPDISGTWDGAGGVGGLLAVTRHARKGQEAESYWATSDLNGNVVGLLATRSKKVALYEYDAFGRQVAVNEPEANLNPIRFSSKYTDVETGFSYYGYRYYSAELGRWISRDPIGDRGGINLYTMLGNDLANEADKLGLINWEKTGVKQCFDGVVHTYIMIDGVSYGFYPKSRSSSDPIDALKNAINIIEGPGVVTSPDPLASQGQTCRDLQVNTTCIEASKVKGHVLDYLNKNLASNNLTYTCNDHNCARFVWDAGLAGVQNSKKKNLNFVDKCACTFSMTHKWE